MWCLANGVHIMSRYPDYPPSQHLLERYIAKKYMRVYDYSPTYHDL